MKMEGAYMDKQEMEHSRDTAGDHTRGKNIKTE